MDDYRAHTAPDARSWFSRNPRFQPHFIPTHSSCLNQVETVFSVMKEKQLKRGVHRSVLSLEKAIHEFLAAHNEDAKPFCWRTTADDILSRVADRCERIKARHSGA